MTIPEEVDIIICGGGSAGCVPAGRLANLDHNLSVLLIEAGEDNLNNPWWAYTSIASSMELTTVRLLGSIVPASTPGT